MIFAAMPSFLRRQHDLLFMSEIAKARCSVAKLRRELAGSMASRDLRFVPQRTIEPSDRASPVPGMAFYF